MENKATIYVILKNIQKNEWYSHLCHLYWTSSGVGIFHLNYNGLGFTLLQTGMKDFGDYVQNALSAKTEHKEFIEIEAI